MNDAVATLAAVKTRISAAARAAGRAENAVSLTAISKTHNASAVAALIAAGQRIFGENRVQEASAKFTGLKLAHPDLHLHLIGPLQTNKAQQAVGLFDVIETLDRPALAAALAKAMTKIGCWPTCYIEVNIGSEPQKAGVTPAQLPDLLAFSRKAGLDVTGLMCIPPQGQEPLPYFQALRQLAETHSLPNLSMGMSGDFETAIACGATAVRIGSALFGARPVGNG